MDSLLVQQIALTLIPGIGPVQAKQLLLHLGADKIFSSKKSVLERIEGIGSFRADCIKKFKDFATAEKEAAFVKSRNIRVLLFGTEDYPKRLEHCYDPPTILFLKGDTDLNAQRIVGIIGTRNHSEYGKHLTDSLVREIASTGAVVVSGLAYGIDAMAHRAAMKHQLQTIGVLAHGLNQLYPPEHTSLATEMIAQGGGLLTEFHTTSKPDKHNFPLRNRIVAGLSDALVVIETGAKGGSMITAELANGYNRDVFAFPGKTTDLKSAGCNHLIHSNKAILLNDGKQLLEAMGWCDDQKKIAHSRQRQLFIDLSPDEKRVVDVLQSAETVHIDELTGKSALTAGTIAVALLNLECMGVVQSLPGRAYRLL